jgi:hypothetical protein
MVNPARQREALKGLMAAIQPMALAVPERVIAQMPPSPYGFDGSNWGFSTTPAGIVFDPLAVARSLASFVVDGLLQPDRVERMIVSHARNAAAPSADEVIDRVIAAVYTDAIASTPYEFGLRRQTRRAVVDALFALAVNPRATADAKAIVDFHLSRLVNRLTSQGVSDTDDRASNAAVVRDARNWLERRITPALPTGVIPLPPGTPIGS